MPVQIIMMNHDSSRTSIYGASAAWLNRIQNGVDNSFSLAYRLHRRGAAGQNRIYCATLGTGPGLTDRTERGNQTRNVVPISEVRSTLTEPMWSWMILLTM